MQFQTTFTIPKCYPLIAYGTPIVTMGSCFSATMGQKLQESKFEVLNNPFGTLFNPLSLFELLEVAVENRIFDEKMVVNHEEKYLHYAAHSSLSAASAALLLQLLQERAKQTQHYLARSSHLIITLGTAHVYEHRQSGRTVANCHKQPAGLFRKKLLTIQEMENAAKAAFAALRELNPSIQIILTVSPVRHIKDGIPENQLSKSLLRVLANQLVSAFPFVHYFPSYEIMMDELRDYRYYAEDLIHPSPLAEKYIWKKFCEALFSMQTTEVADKIHKIHQSLSHRPFNPQSQAHRLFLQNLLQKMEQMEPEFDFSIEISQLRQALFDKL